MSKNDQRPAFYVLEVDKKWARDRIAELEKAIQDLGPEFNIALNQSNETWHDNAPFDALRDTQAIMVAEMQALKETLFKAAISVPKPPKNRIGLGSRVEVKTKTGPHSYILAGHWSPWAGKKREAALIVSCASPLGSVLMNAKIGDQIVIPTNHHVLAVTSIDNQPQFDSRQL